MSKWTVNVAVDTYNTSSQSRELAIDCIALVPTNNKHATAEQPYFTFTPNHRLDL